MLQETDRLLQFYEGGAITRRQLLARLVAVHGAGAGIVRQATNGAFTGRNINHVTLSVADVARSAAFYRELLGATPLTTYPEGTDLRVGDGFIGIYSLDRAVGVDHFSVGVQDFDPDRAFRTLQERYSSASPSRVVDKLGYKQVYLRDPDGIRVQLSSPTYKL